MAVSGFPLCGDGDVEIRLSSNPKDKLVLNSHTLTLHSTWFKASLSERWNGGDMASTSVFGSGNSGARDSGKHYWVYELRFEKDSALGVLTRKVDARSSEDTELFSAQPLQTVGATALALILHAERLACIKAHRNLFAIPYWADLQLDDGDLDRAIASIKKLTSVADLYGCTHLPKRDVEIQLSKFRDEVLDRCTTDPVAMLDLAMTVKTGWIFMEAAMAVIGSDKLAYLEMQQGIVDLGIYELFSRKRNELVEKLRAVEHELLIMQDIRATGWGNKLALSFFRDWLSQQLQAGHGSSLRPLYTRVYHDMIGNEFWDPSPSRQQMLADFCGEMGINPTLMPGDLMLFVKQVFITARTSVLPLIKDNRKIHNTRIFNGPFKNVSIIGVSEEELPWVTK